MFAPTTSPTVHDDTIVASSAPPTLPTVPYWTLLSAFRVLRVQAGSPPADVFRVSQRATIPTGDGGANLLRTLADDLNQELYNRYCERQGALLSESARPRVALSPVRIVDSTIEEIRPPHLEALDWIRQATGFSQERIAELVGVSRQTLNRWVRNEPIKDVNRRRVFAVREVLERASVRFKTRAALLEWLDTPRGADGRTPAECLASGDINRARLLAISTPSPGVSRAPAWVTRPVPEAFRKGTERLPEAVPPEPEIEDADD